MNNFLSFRYRLFSYPSFQSTTMTTECEPRLKVHDFEAEVLQQKIYYHVIKMKDSLFIWIGTQPAKMGDLAVAMNTKYVRV